MSLVTISVFLTWLFHAQVLLTLVVNPYPYTDRAADFVQEASTLQASVGRQDTDDVSIPISHIDGRCLALLHGWCEQ
jgi:hypothetical protein